MNLFPSSSANVGVNILVSLDFRKHETVFKRKYLRHTSLVDSSNSNEIIWLISYIAQL